MAKGAKPAAAVATAALLLGSMALADDVARGQAKSAVCVACHGAAGITPNPMFPHLAGQNPAYLATQLEHFRSGERYHPLMTPIAQSLSPRDDADLAAYYASVGQ